MKSSLAIADLKSTLQKSLQNLSAREQALIALGIATLIFILLYNCVGQAASIFSEQRLTIKQSEADAELLPSKLATYLELKNKYDIIQNHYHGIEISDGALSYLEKLVREKANIPAGQFEIKDLPPRNFGAEYEQLSFQIKFSTIDFKAFIAFLKDLIEGAKPFILSKLDLNRGRGQERLQVDIEVSAIRKKK